MWQKEVRDEKLQCGLWGHSWCVCMHALGGARRGKRLFSQLRMWTFVSMCTFVYPYVLAHTFTRDCELKYLHQFDPNANLKFNFSLKFNLNTWRQPEAARCPPSENCQVIINHESTIGVQSKMINREKEKISKVTKWNKVKQIYLNKSSDNRKRAWPLTFKGRVTHTLQMF